MSTVQLPTLLSPNGGEVLVFPTVIITWAATAPLDSSGNTCWFEVYYTDSYRDTVAPNWILLATLDSAQRSYEWSLGNLSSTQMRVAVRCRNAIGDHSDFSVSAANFTVNRNHLPVPQVASPVNGGIYDSLINIVVVDTSVPKRNYYHFSYSCASLGVNRTTIAPLVPSSSLPYIWNTLTLGSADDYTLFVMSVDRNGNTSEVVSIKNIIIRHEGYVIIDTTPPETSFVVNEGLPYTKNQNVNVKLYLYDQATDVQAIQLSESGSSSSPPPQAKANTVVFPLSTGDGFKNIQLLAQDWGMNRNTKTYRLFTNALALSSGTVVDFAAGVLKGVGVVYIVTDGDVRALYAITTFPRLLTTLTDAPTAIGIYSDEVYVASKTTGGVGYLSKYTESSFIPVYQYTDPGEHIVTLAVMGSLLLWGTNTGRLFSFDGITTAEVENLSHATLAAITGGIAITRIESDKCCAFIHLTNTTTLYVYDGKTLYGVST